MPKATARIARAQSNLLNAPDVQGRIPDTVKPNLVGFNKPKDMLALRSRSFSKDTRIALANDTRMSDVPNSRRAYKETLKKLPRGALDRPNATKFDNTYLAPFSGDERGSTGRTQSTGRGHSQRQNRGLKGGPVEISNNSPMPANMATRLFDTATGMKLQMLKMVRDLNTNQDRSDSAATILKELGSDPTSDHVDEAIFLNFYASVQNVKDSLGEVMSEVRAEMRDKFAILSSERDLMTDDVAEMVAETSMMKQVVDKIEASVVAVESVVGRAEKKS